MRVLRYLVALFALLAAPAAFAQSTANEVLPGVLTTVGCPGGQTPCWRPYSALNPLPVGGFTTSTPLGYQQITSLASSTALTVPTGSTVAVISVETANIRYRDDGTAPTTTVGMPLNSGQTFLYNGSLSAFRVIAVSGSPVVNVSYYK